jgi:chromosome segregation ATPase
VKKPTVITDLEVKEVSLVSSPANPPSRVTLLKSKAAPACRLCTQSVGETDHFCKGCGAPFYKNEDHMDEKKAEEIAKAAAEKAATEKAAVEADLAKAQATISELQKAAARVEALEKSLAAEQKIRKTADTEARVKSVMKAVPAPSAELAGRLVALADTDAELATYVETLLTKCSELIEKSPVLEQVADTTSVAKAEATGDQSIEEKVEALVTKKMAENPGMSRTTAEPMVWSENRDLWQAQRERVRKASK